MKNRLEQLCKKHKASFKWDENRMVIHCTNTNQYNIVLAMVHKIGKFDIETKCDFTWKFWGDIIIKF